METEHFQDAHFDQEMEPNPRLNELTRMRLLKDSIK
jgi:hypothetical protein